MTTSSAASPAKGEAAASNAPGDPGHLGSANAPTAERRREILAARFLLFLLAWLFGIALVGAGVRLTGSGMSIPDWPLIYYGEGRTAPSILPPFTESAWQEAKETYHRDYLWPETGLQEGVYISDERFKREFAIEYAHRALVKLFGLLYLPLLAWVFWKPGLRRKVGAHLGAATLVLVGQILLGGAVVRQHTPELLVSFHLGTAVIFISLVVWSLLILLRRPEEVLPPAPPRLSLTVWAVVVIAFLQVFTGGIMAKTEAARVQQLATWPMMGERLVPPGEVLFDDTISPAIANFTKNPWMVQFVHRWWAFVLAGAMVWMAARLIAKPLTRSGRWALRASIFILALQILVGILTLLHMVPVSLGLAHLGTGLVLFLLLVALLYEVRTNNAIHLLELEALRAAERRFEASTE